jgi:glycosyltransferase involved in cell wall biosynthesis
MQRRRIWILTRHYPPDVGALSYRLAHLAGVLAVDHDVTVLASQPNRYADAAAAPKHELVDGVTVRRVSAVRLLRSRGKVGRLLTELLGALWLALVALRHRRHIDVAFASMPPFFYALPGLAVKRLGRRTLVLDVRDLWLDWAEETGLVRSRLVRGSLRVFERAALRAADRVTTTTNGFKDLLTDRYGLPPERVTVVFNGLDDRLAPDTVAGPRVSPGRPLRILYAGNLGPSQNLASLVEGFRASLEAHPDLEITIVGDGSQREALAAAGHDRLHVLAHIGRDELAARYAEADAFLLHLADLAVYRHTVPSKVFEYAAFGRPILCGVRGEARAIAFRHADCYGFASDDPASFAAAVDRLRAGAEPDNASVARGNRSELLRSSRDPLWRNVFGEDLP